MTRLALYLKTRWLLIAVIIVFVCFKIPHLHYGFYIDEGWVYAPAIKTMALHGPSLMPDAIPPELSRGHPLLFHFLCTLWIKIFGASNIPIHSFALLVSIIFLIALFEGCRKLFGNKVASLALLLVATRVIFFVQASFAYPEIMMALFSFLALYYYSRDELLPTALALSALFFTKEGGLIIGAIIGVHAVISLFRNSGSVSRKMARIGALLLPTVLIATFFIVQKAKLGWYLLPEHSDLVKTDWNSYYIMLKSGLYWAFRGDKAMYVLVCFVLLLSIAATLITKNLHYLLLLPPAFIVFSQAEMFPTKATDCEAWTVLFTVSCILAIYLLLRVNNTLTAQARTFIILSGICVVAYVLYSSLTQIAYRYLQVNIFFTLIFLAVCIVTFIEATGMKLLVPSVATVLLIGAYGFYTNDRAEDTQLGAYRTMNVQMSEFAFLEKEKAYEKKVAFGCTWEQLRLTDTLQGFLSSGRTFTQMIRFPVPSDADYAIFGNSCEDTAEYHRMRTNPSFYSVYRVSDGEMWAEVFKHRTIENNTSSD